MVRDDGKASTRCSMSRGVSVQMPTGCAGCAGTRKAWPGTKENAFALSLLIATAILVRYRWTSEEVVVRNARETGRDMGTNEPDGSREQGNGTFIAKQGRQLPRNREAVPDLDRHCCLFASFFFLLSPYLSVRYVSVCRVSLSLCRRHSHENEGRRNRNIL